MAHVRYNPNVKQNGKVIYNESIVNSIASLAVNEVEGAELVSGKKGIRLYFEKEGVYADISVIVKYGYNIPELAFRIQQTIKQNVESMTVYKIAKVNVHIAGVVFPAAEAEKKPAEPAPAPTEENK